MFNRNRNRGKSSGGEHNGFQNPTWAPSIRVHKKEWETEVQRKISEFAQSNDIRVVFPPMDSQQRKRVHELINRHGLLSHSEGRDPERYVVLLRKKRQSLPLSALSIDSTPVILSKDMHEKIYQLMMSYNITDHDVSHHLSVRTARKATRARIYNKDIKPMIVPPRSQASNAILDQRRKLPTFSYRNLIIEAICRNKVVLITGGTGCGKTTQIPQFLLEEAAESNKPLKIICTQPRRLPAIAVAERVSMERGEPLGSTVGYHIRLEQKTSASTVLTYCTSGVLLRMLTQDDVVKNLSHIILDEIHEREQNTDYLLIALKQAIVKERDLKIVLMSATMEGNLDMFKQYFGDVPVQHIDVPSRLYPVEKIHLGEILAMTGYTPPDSVFTSMSGLAQSHSLQSQSFPSMSHWTPDQGQSSFQQKDSFAANYNVPPPVMQQSTQPSKYEQIAQQLAQSQAAPNQQSFRQPTYHEQPGYHQGTQQGGMTHAATWSGGMDQATKLFPSQPSMLHHPSPSHPSSNNPDVIEYPTTDKDASELEAAFPQLAIGQHVYNQQQPQYHPHQTNNMQYFQSPMDGSVGYSAEFASNSQSALNTMQQQQPLSRSFNELAQASSFGQSMREESERADNLRTILRQSYPQRQNERFFTPEGLDRMRQHLGPRTELLAEAYGGLGGSQYAECVDIDLIISTALFLMDSSVDGAILIFLPGFEEITSVREKLVESCRNTKIKPEIFTLHSQMNSSDQHRVFEHPGKGRRKVILSTNIAEASLTIDDVVFVIDTGKVKEKSYDHDSRISQLKIAWIAKSNAEQRSGRAGRCRVGFCFRLYSQKDFGLLAPTQKAEMQRAAIHEVCLHAKLFAPEKMSVKEFLSMAPEPPPTSAIDHSMEFLEQLGALYSEASTSDIDLAESYLPCLPQKEAELTDLGTLISKLPVEPQLARMLLFGLAFRCLQPTVTLVAALSHRDPFLIPHPDDRERCNRIRERFAQSDLSDHLALLRAINQFDSSRKQADFCRTNFISYPAMKMIIGIRKQLLSELRRANLIQDPSQALNDPEYNKYSGSWPMIQAAIAAGCYPGIGFTKAGSKLRKIKTSSDTKNAGLHPSSVIKRQILSMARKEQAQDGPVVEYLAYQELAQLDEGLTLKTVTVIPPVTAILIIGGLRMKQSAIKEFTLICEQESLEVEKALLEEDGGDKITPEFGCIPSLHVYVIEDWLACKGTHASLRALLRLRFKIMQYFHEFVAHPHLLHTQSSKYDDLLEVLANVLYDDHQKQGFKDVNSIDVYQQDSYHYRNFDRPNGMRKGNNFQQPQSLNQNLAQPVHPQQLPPQPTPVQPSGSQQHHPEPLQQFIRPLPPPPQVLLNQNLVPGGGAYNTEESRHVVLPSSSSTAKQPLRSDDVRDYQKRDTGGFNFHNTFSPFYFPTSNPPTPQAAQPLEDSPPPDPVMHSSNRQKDASQRSDYNRPRMMAKAEQSQNERKANSFGRINQDEGRDVRRNEVSRTYGKPSSTEYSDAGSSGRRRAGHRTTKVPFMKDYHNGGKYANGGDNETKQHLQYRSTANPSGEQDEQNGQQQERPGRFKKPVGRTHHNKSYVNSAFKRSCNASNNSNSSSVGHR